MKPFRFRAAAVLDLRRRQHEHAETQLARAQAERDAAQRAVAAAEAACARAHAEYREQLGTNHTAGLHERHRNWIARKQRETEDQRRQLDARLLEVHRATAEVQGTYMRLRALERLRDRAWRTYQDETRRRDAIDMDHLAVMQHARRTRGGIEL
jgi:flagellar export protein FliJ